VLHGIYLNNICLDNLPFINYVFLVSHVSTNQLVTELIMTKVTGIIHRNFFKQQVHLLVSKYISSGEEELAKFTIEDFSIVIMVKHLHQLSDINFLLFGSWPGFTVKTLKLTEVNVVPQRIHGGVQIRTDGVFTESVDGHLCLWASEISFGSRVKRFECGFLVFCSGHRVGYVAENMKAAFEAFDSGTKGYLTRPEAQMAVHALGKNPIGSELNTAMNPMGDNINFTQFQGLYSKAWPTPEQQEADIRKLMQMLDHDDNGKVLDGEFRQLLLSTGDFLTHQEVDLLFEEVPMDDAGYFRHDQLSDKLVGGHMGH